MVFLFSFLLNIWVSNLLCPIFIRTSMFTLQEIESYANRPKQIISFLRSVGLLRGVRILHSFCFHRPRRELTIQNRNAYLDGKCYRCNKCRTTISIRYGSIFYHSLQELIVCCRMLVYFSFRHCHSNIYIIIFT